jgi:hypothetical protein
MTIVILRGLVTSTAVGGTGGFKLVGLALGRRSALPAARNRDGRIWCNLSVYSLFISRGCDVVFPKNTSMEIGFGGRISPQKPGQVSPAKE